MVLSVGLSKDTRDRHNRNAHLFKPHIPEIMMCHAAFKQIAGDLKTNVQFGRIKKMVA